MIYEKNVGFISIKDDYIIKFVDNRVAITEAKLNGEKYDNSKIKDDAGIQMMKTNFYSRRNTI